MASFSDDSCDSWQATPLLALPAPEEGADPPAVPAAASTIQPWARLDDPADMCHVFRAPRAGSTGPKTVLWGGQPADAPASSSATPPPEQPDPAATSTAPQPVAGLAPPPGRFTALPALLQQAVASPAQQRPAAPAEAKAGSGGSGGAGRGGDGGSCGRGGPHTGWQWDAQLWQEELEQYWSGDWSWRDNDWA